MDYARIELIDTWRKQFVRAGGSTQIDWEPGVRRYHEKNGRLAIPA